MSLNLLELAGIDVNRDQKISYDELDKAIERVFGAIKAHYTVTAPDAPVAIVADRYQIVDDHVLQIDIRYSFGHSVTQLDVTSTLDQILGEMHQHLARARIGGELNRQVLDESNPTAHFDARHVTPVRIVAVVFAALGLVGLGIYRFTRRSPTA